MNRCARLVAVAFFATLPNPSLAAELPRNLPPVEQCSGDRGFVQFRNRVTQIVEKKDKAAFLALLAPDVLVNFGGATGRDEFVKAWSFDATEYGNVWSQLEKMLKMGCARDGGSRIIPSLPMQVEQDSNEDWVVVLPPGAMIFKWVGDEVVYSEVRKWTVATVTSRVSDTTTDVKLPDGREGSISDDYLYEPGGYRMIVEKRRGRWTITAFVAGD